ncbi:MAG: efflux RND transporter periplasmic adaptor subunit [candidate division Zixibacteria bacterium]|nr:efflux RND transporter periplasmic adaptor subunit [candidate division Zixibacteria bacterium]
MVKKILFIGFIVVLVGGVLFFAINGSAQKDESFQTFEVKKGSIVEKALAVGQIEPRKEISVKSKISGIVKRIHVEIGDIVKIGDPLIDVEPDPTPIEYAEARRQVEIYQVAFDNAEREYKRARTLREKELISNQDTESKQAAFDEASLRLKLAKEKLSLIESGQTEIADLKVDNTIRSTVTGMVLSRLVNEGDPVVPLTSYQAGTELMTLAYMDDLVFMGTVDEIDVGKLHVSMPAEIKVGALPKDTVTGRVDKISPKARQDQGSTVFDVEISLTDMGTNLLRAGYSANADIIIKKKEDILIIQERLVEFVEDTAFVETQDTLGVVSKIPIEVGLSNGIDIEVTSGLSEGDQIIERPPREIQ